MRTIGTWMALFWVFWFFRQPLRDQCVLRWAPEHKPATLVHHRCK